jgi:hypothetical protein
MRFILFLALFIGFTVTSAKADPDSGLYDPVPPEGAALVRYVNFSNEALSPQLDSKDFGPVASKKVSPYFVVLEGVKELQMGDELKKLNLSGENFYTIVYHDEITVFLDKPNNNRAKATIGLYNLGSKKPLSLWAENGTVELLKNVEPYGVKSRQINSVKTDFGVYRGKIRLADLGEEIIERNNYYSIFYALEKIIFVPAEIDTTK